MTDGPTNPVSASLIDRVKNIIVSPKTEWARIAAEPATVGGLFTGYAMILAAIPLICGIAGSLLFTSALGVFRPPVTFIVVLAVLGYVVTLGVVYLMGLIIGALAPSFGGTNDKISGFKLSVYASTPVWIAGVLTIFPPLALLVWLAYLYVIYVIYTGVGPVLRVPEDKSVVTTIVIIACYIVLQLVLTMIISAIVFAMFASVLMGAAASVPTAF